MLMVGVGGGTLKATAAGCGPLECVDTALACDRVFLLCVCVGVCVQRCLLLSLSPNNSSVAVSEELQTLPRLLLALLAITHASRDS